MAYGQKNYNELQGINGKYRIAQIGCFLTAFSNLSTRFGYKISPLDLNKKFKTAGVYIDIDDGIRDDLAWTSISKYNKNIVVTKTGTGKPPSNNAIVKFVNIGTFGTHFALVADRNAGTIVDSWDGKTKSWNTYGGPVAWATYQDNKPKPKPAPAPAPKKPSNGVINITVQPGWGLSHVLKAAGYPQSGWEDSNQWLRLSAYNGAPGGLRLKVGQVVKVPKYEPIVVPKPVKVVEQPKPIEKPAPVNEPPVVILKPNPLAWKETYRDDVKIYVAKINAQIDDIEGLHLKINLIAGQKVPGAGLFEKNGVTYVRTKKSVENNTWYGIPLDVLSEGQEPDKFIGPLTDDDDDDEIFDIDFATELNEAIKGNARSSKDRLLKVMGSIAGLFARLFNKKETKGVQ